jgi:hypothetical protein
MSIKKSLPIVFLLLLFIFYNCKNRNPEKSMTEIDSIDARGFFDSYHGFIISNSQQRDFYCVNRSVMQKYISNVRIDTVTMKEDLKKAEWCSFFKGKSYDCFCWCNYLGLNSDIDSIMLETCKKRIKSQIIPVYITQFNNVLNNEKNKLDKCNKVFHTEIYSQPHLNLVYIAPLNDKQLNDYLDVRDTISRVRYNKYLNNGVW